jgi:hypothetical protein
VKPRDSILILGGMALAAAIAAMLMTMGGAGEATGSAPVPGMLPLADTGNLQADRELTAPNPAPLMGTEPGKQRLENLGMTSGIIRGDIALEPAIVERIQSITVTVQELAGGDGDNPPFSRSKNVVMQRGTPTFEVRGIPFSRNGFSVRVFSPGLNGSEQVVAVTELEPIADAVLGISSPVAFSILLRDQLRNFVTNTKVIMKPVELPLGRPWLNGETDNYGSVLFEEVLAGDFLIFVGDTSAPLVKPVRVTIQPPGPTFQPELAYLRGQPVKNQFVRITVPRGQALEVSVTGPAGYGLKDAKLSMLTTSSVLYQPYDGVTDYNGRHVFPHLPAGEYQLDVELAGHQRWSRTVRWKEGEAPPQVEVRLIPRRN